MRRLFRTIRSIIPFKKELFTIVRSIYTPPPAIYRHLHFNGTFKVKIYDSFFILRSNGFFIENEIFWSGIFNAWEKVSLFYFSKIARESSVIIDVGANIGIYALTGQAVNRQATIFAFEPLERNFNKLKNNALLNKFPLQCYEAALSNYDGTASIWDTNVENNLSVTVNVNTAGSAPNVTEVKIKTIRLDTFITSNNITKIDLLKIDVEMHEVEVLEGMGEYLSRFTPSMLIEIVLEENAKKIEALISGLGYLYYNINEIDKPRRVEHLTRSDHYNFLLCKRDVAIRLGLDV